MGVIALWPLLEPVRRTKSLQELKGQKIAIDLSAWIMGCKRVAVASGFRNVYLRTIFLRTLDLLQNGIQPVFVCDGCIPKIKFNKIRHRWKGCSFGKSGPIFRERSQSDTTKICRHLFECLGLPFLESEGEGEALCAFLNQKEIVDGCLTSDSDVLLYGATKVYRNYTKKKKVGYLESYDAKEIFNQMKLDQRTLVALALLLGCDYNGAGVPGVGVKTAMRMIREMQITNIDALQRMLSWRSDHELQELQEQMDTFNEEKHCRECLHIVASHSQNGCGLCGANINVSEDLDDCQCPCHSFLEKFLSHEEEFKVREKAMLDHTFPSQEIIEEFLIPTESKDLKVDISWHEPNFEDLQSFVRNHLHWTGYVLFKTLVPLLVHWKLNSSTFACLEGFEPLRILKKHRKDYQLLYQVVWSKTSEDVWTKEAIYTCSVDRELFRKRFPEMVKLFEQSLIPAKTMEDHKKSISNLPHRVTRGALKKEGLTLSEMKDGNKDFHIHDDKSETCPQETPVRQSKRLIEKKKAVRVTRSSVQTNSGGLKRSSKSCRRHTDSIPNLVDKIKKQKKMDSANTQDVEMHSSDHFNLVGICSVTIPSINDLQATVQRRSVNRGEAVLDGNRCLSENSENDRIESNEEELESVPKMTNLNSFKGSLHEVSVVGVNLNVMDSTVAGSNLDDKTMSDGSNAMNSIVEGPKCKDTTMMADSHAVDSSGGDQITLFL